ncbi:unnamed protein product [Rodentolepis nana]|uniref:G_PROTEIN_RECEP_F1_2 domain-containing protein n=1 Tax=Rodentolepis nana TaxID=102285 RepID=A0A0R3TCP9_RODNA|nr:unnamed protein product [Rodentolepis nana]
MLEENVPNKFLLPSINHLLRHRSLVFPVSLAFRSCLLASQYLWLSVSCLLASQYLWLSVVRAGHRIRWVFSISAGHRISISGFPSLSLEWDTESGGSSPFPLDEHRIRWVFSISSCIYLWLSVLVFRAGHQISNGFDSWPKLNSATASILGQSATASIPGQSVISESANCPLHRAVYALKNRCPLLSKCVSKLPGETLFVFSVVVYGQLKYKHSSGVYEFPHYSVVMGWLLASCSVACIPIVALYRIIKAEGTLWQRLKDLCQPNLTTAALMNLEAFDELAPKTGNSVDQELCVTTEIEVSNTKLPDSCPLKMTDSGTKSS